MDIWVYNQSKDKIIKVVNFYITKQSIRNNNYNLSASDYNNKKTIVSTFDSQQEARNKLNDIYEQLRNAKNEQKFILVFL